MDFVESLLEEDQDLLFDLIHKRRVEKRRSEIAQNANRHERSQLAPVEPIKQYALELMYKDGLRHPFRLEW